MQIRKGVLLDAQPWDVTWWENLSGHHEPSRVLLCLGYFDNNLHLQWLSETIAFSQLESKGGGWPGAIFLHL